MQMPQTEAPAEPVRLLEDSQELNALVHRLCACLDEARFDDLRGILTADATARTPGGVAEGVDALIAQARRNHSTEDHIQHLVTGVLVDLDGDLASMRANLMVTFARAPGALLPSMWVGEVYRFAARREPEGWRLTGIETSPVWRSLAPLDPVAATR